MNGAATASEPTYLQRLWQLRYFLFAMVNTDLRTRYKRSFLGVGWSLIRPIAMTTVLCLVFAKVFNLDTEHYAPFLLCGLTLWQFIHESATLGCNAFLLGAPYMRQQPLPLALFPLRTALGAGIHTGIAFVITLGLVYITSGNIHWHVLPMVAVALLALLVLCWALAAFCGMLHTLFPDTQHMLEIFFQVVFYLTPILYPPEMVRSRERFAWLLDVNPLTSVIQVIRQPVLEGTYAPLQAHLIFLAFTAAMLTLTIVFMRKMEKKLVFWI